MHIKLNNKSIQVDLTCTLQALLDSYQTSEAGVAVAINDTVIPHSSWPSTTLSEHDEITLFQAIAGG
ncbi:MAG: sulfur carrier protein ThiS [Paraglaciecola sp.]|uniref:sulfur carrier protein ThiS n=1 Tax=Paraglaciecola sp. TaxID=1920173 RepID=UPI00329A49D8